MQDCRQSSYNETTVNRNLANHEDSSRNASKEELLSKNSSRPKTPLDQKLLPTKNSSRRKTPLDQKSSWKKTPLEKTPLDLETLEKIPSSLMCENNSNEFIKHLFCFVLIYIAVGSRQHMLQGVTSHPFPYPPPGDAFGCRCKLLFGKGSEEPHPQKPHIPNVEFFHHVTPQSKRVGQNVHQEGRDQVALP